MSPFYFLKITEGLCLKVILKLVVSMRVSLKTQMQYSLRIFLYSFKSLENNSSGGYFMCP